MDTEAENLIWAAQSDIEENRPDRARRWLEDGYRMGILTNKVARQLLEKGCLELSLTVLLRELRD
jgi:hypothetical protein